MKIRNVVANARRKVVELRAARRSFVYPFARLQPRPSAQDPIIDVRVDDPAYLRDRLLYALTLEAQKRIQKCSLSRREIIRRLGTSPAQFYRLLDQTNYSKSVDQLVSLLQALDCDVQLTVRARPA